MIEENNLVNEDGSYIGPANLSPIPLSVGSPIIKAEDKGKLRANAVEAMHHYANQEMALLKKQADLIMEQLKVSENIYTSDMRFQPVIGQVYHLYEKDDHFKLSIIGPTEWGRSKTVGNYVASVKLLGDHSWDIINKA